MIKKGVIALMVSVILIGCRNESTSDNYDEDALKIYYINQNETKIVSENYIPVGKTITELVDECFQIMDTEPINDSWKKAKPDNVVIKSYTINDEQLSIYFDSGYTTMSKVTEVLARAAIVKTLSQIEGITYVEFYINEQPLMDINDKPVGLMTKEKFIENTANGVSAYQNTFITLFFSNDDGTGLIENVFIAPYDGNIPMEQLVIERLMEPGVDFVNRTIPEGTQLIKVTVKDGVCYVDFNEKFLDKTLNVRDSVTIYSIVNSLAELPTINKVQFTINGEKRKYFREGKTNFDGFFERNLDIVESNVK